MSTTSKVQKFWVFVAKVKDQHRFKIALRPFHYRSQTVTKPSFLFISQRPCTSEKRAMQEALWLFGALAWKRVGANLKAPVAFSCTAP
jgi:hypothetical protein